MIECCLLYKVMVPSMTSVLHEGHIYYTILGHDESTDQEWCMSVICCYMLHVSYMLYVCYMSSLGGGYVRGHGYQEIREKLH